MVRGNEKSSNTQDAAQRRTLLQVLLLNAGLAAGLLIAGLSADSSALIANALDNTSDAFVYGISYYAVPPIATLENDRRVSVWRASTDPCC